MAPPPTGRDCPADRRDSAAPVGRRARTADLTGSPSAPVAGVRLLPPLRPPTVRDYMTFESHVAGVVPGDGDTVPEERYAAPAFYPVVHVGRELHAVLASASVGAGPIRAGLGGSPGSRR